MLSLSSLERTLAGRTRSAGCCCSLTLASPRQCDHFGLKSLSDSSRRVEVETCFRLGNRQEQEVLTPRRKHLQSPVSKGHKKLQCETEDQQILSLLVTDMQLDKMVQKKSTFWIQRWWWTSLSMIQTNLALSVLQWMCPAHTCSQHFHWWVVAIRERQLPSAPSQEQSVVRPCLTDFLFLTMYNCNSVSNFIHTAGFHLKISQLFLRSTTGQRHFGSSASTHTGTQRTHRNASWKRSQTFLQMGFSSRARTVRSNRTPWDWWIIAVKFYPLSPSTNWHHLYHSPCGPHSQLKDYFPITIGHKAPFSTSATVPPVFQF